MKKVLFFVVVTAFIISGIFVIVLNNSAQMATSPLIGGPSAVSPLIGGPSAVSPLIGGPSA